MSNAIPCEFAGRGPGFYDSNTDAEGGLKLVSLKRPEPVVSTIATRCACGVKVTLINGVVEAPCPGCGKIVSILKK
jgi:hypothetical protein